jgi:PAS domain S-box-containing protein
MSDAPRRSIHVLHVDDDEDFAEAAAAALERRDGLTVTTETSPTAALDHVATDEDPVDCIVSAYESAGMNGLELLGRVRETDPDLPFVLYTGEGSEEIASRAISVGVTDYLRKQDGVEQFALLADRIVDAVTEVRTEHARRRADARLRAFAANPSLVVLTIDETSTVEYVNDAVEHVLGYRPAELRGEALATIIPDRLESAHFAALDRYLRTGERTFDWSGVELPALHADGHEVPVEVSFGESVIDGDRRLTGVIRDVTERKRREQELERQRDLFEQTQRIARMGGWELDLAEDELRWTDEIYRIYGLPLDYEPTVADALEFFHPEDRPAIEAAIERAIDCGEDYDLELRFVTADDDLRWVRARGEARREAGETVMLRGTFQDITERKAREQDLRSTSSLLSTLVENIPAGILVEDGARRVRFTNRAFTELFDIQVAPDDLVGSDCAAAAEHLEGLFVESNRFIDSTNDAVAAHTTIRSEAFELVDGRTLERSGTPVELEDERPGYLWVYHDITARKRRERRLSALHEATRKLMVSDTRQEIAEVASRAARDVLGLPLNGVHLYDEEVGGLVPLTVSPESREVVGEPPTFREGEGIAWQVFESGEPRIYGDVRTESAVYDSTTPIRSELHLPLGDHGIFLIGSTDVDDLDEADVSLAKVLAANVQAALDRAGRERALRNRERELQRQNERLDEFARVVTHDLRNPLNVAMGRLDLVEEAGDTDHLETVARAHGRMKRIIEDVLTLARQGETVGETEPVSLDAVARRAWENVDTGAATLQVDTGRTIDADTGRVEQLLENLLRNAVEHGGEAVTVRVGWDDARPGFYVEDTGRGIPPETRARVFESGYTTAAGGTGLGLAIVEEIVVAHGWEIEVTDGTEGGTRFEITTGAE